MSAMHFKGNIPRTKLCVCLCIKVYVMMVSMVIWQVVLIIFDAPQTIRVFPIESNVIGLNRGENEFNLTLLIVFIIL